MLEQYPKLTVKIPVDPEHLETFQSDGLVGIESLFVPGCSSALCQRYPRKEGTECHPVYWVLDKLSIFCVH